MLRRTSILRGVFVLRCVFTQYSVRTFHPISSGKFAQLLFILVLAAQCLPVHAQVSQPPKFVFAHYLLCNFCYGSDATGQSGSVAGYEHDIQDAQAAGIDGFALNIGAWTPGYQGSIIHMFQAANALPGGFKLFFSLDTTGSLTPAQIRALVTLYAQNPAYFQYQSQPVLSTWGGTGGGYTAARNYWGGILSSLRASGINPYFVPAFSLVYSDGSSASPTAAHVSSEVTGLLSGLANGQFLPNTAFCPLDPTETTMSVAKAYGTSLRAAGMTLMSGVSPQYWGSKQIPGRRYFEYDGGEGAAAQWQSIINVQKPDWVELFTWNDFDEGTYYSPCDPNKAWSGLLHSSVPGFYRSHAGALALASYYIQWFKTGAQPVPTSDHIYFFYRTQPADLVADEDELGPTTYRSTPGGPVPDCLFITTILTGISDLQVTTGDGVIRHYSIGPGIKHTRLQAVPGNQSFELYRKGVWLMSAVGVPIVADASEYNFNYYSGYAGD